MMHFTTVVIEFGLPEQGAVGLPPGRPPGRLIRLVESQAKAGRTFILYDGDRRVYVLTAEETDQFLHLLEQIVVKAPWEAMPAARQFDGPRYTLLLKGPLSETTFHWGVKMPQEWASVGVVMDYALGLAERCGLWRSR